MIRYSYDQQRFQNVLKPKKITWTNKRRAEHPFAGQNTQHMSHTTSGMVPWGGGGGAVIFAYFGSFRRSRFGSLDQPGLVPQNYVA